MLSFKPLVVILACNPSLWNIEGKGITMDSKSAWDTSSVIGQHGLQKRLYLLRNRVRGEKNNKQKSFIKMYNNLNSNIHNCQ